MKRNVFTLLGGSGLLVSAFMHAAQAQSPPAANATETARAEAETTSPASALEEVVVTGTLIRGIAPVGANALNISDQDIQSSGLLDSVQLLNNLVPQSNDFMQVEQIGRNSSLAGAHSPLTRPELRDLGDENSESGSPTLVMLDGHRIVPMGIQQSTIDVGIIPPGLIDHQEIVLDGTSAVYGSDAVAGTINYITRKRFDATEVNVHSGFADQYWQVSADVTSGIKWDTGGIAFAYSYAKNSNLLEGERSYALPRNYLLPGAPFTATACNAYSTVTAGGRSVATPSLTQTASPCADPFDSATLVAAQERNSGFVTISQDIGTRVKFDMTAFYTSRQIDQIYADFTSVSTIRPTNPYFTLIPGVPAASQASQSVSYSWGSVFGNSASNELNYLKVGQVSPTIAVDLGGGWVSRSLFSYGRSTLSIDQNTLDSTRVIGLAAGTTTATALDPYNIAATSPSLFPGLTYDNHQEGDHTFTQGREIADGPLFALPGGDLRAAIGAEWTRTTLKTDLTNGTSHLVQPFLSTSQDDTSVFGELNVPIVGPRNARPGIEALTLSVSARNDHYNDFGNTFNPKIAFNYEPVDWIKVRGNWGKSFRAPNVADKLGTRTSSFFCVGTNVNGCTNFPATPLPGQALAAGTNVIFTLQGVVPNLKPETSKNWAVGFDISPPILPHFTLSPTFWEINFKQAISLPPISVTQAYTQGLAKLITVAPTAAQINAIASTVPNGLIAANIVTSGGYNVLYIYDDRTQNLNRRNLDGIDLLAHYTYPIRWGSLDTAFNGSWTLRDVTALSPTAPFFSAIATGTPKFRMTESVGASIRDFRAQLTWEHQSGYAVLPSATQCSCQTTITSFDLLNLSFQYNLNGAGSWTKDTRLTLTVNNIFDADPPVSKTTAGTFANGSTVGRLFELGIDKKF